jgi:hypothetical protein
MMGQETSNYVNKTSTNVSNVNVSSSDIIVPTDKQSGLQKTIQTHNAVSVALSSNSTSSTWIDCDGFDKLAITLLNDAGTSSFANAYWSNDGVSTHGMDTVIAASTQQQKAGVVDVKARYLKVLVGNSDATLAHTMSAWAYLKA